MTIKTHADVQQCRVESAKAALMIPEAKLLMAQFDLEKAERRIALYRALFPLRWRRYPTKL